MSLGTALRQRVSRMWHDTSGILAHVWRHQHGIPLQQTSHMCLSRTCGNVVGRRTQDDTSPAHGEALRELFTTAG